MVYGLVSLVARTCCIFYYLKSVEIGPGFRLNLGYYLRRIPGNAHPPCDADVFLILQFALRLVNVYDKNMYENPATGSSDRGKKFFRFHVNCPHLFTERKKTYICVQGQRVAYHM